EGIRRSRQSFEKAEFILHIFDASEPFASVDEIFLREFARKKRIIVRNKIDLPAQLNFPASLPGPVVDVSCLTGHGLEVLKEKIKELLWSGDIKTEMLEVMINSRHQDALNRARIATERTVQTLRDEQTLELVAMELRIAVNAIGEIVGKT